MNTVLHTYGGSNHLQWADFALLLGEHVGAFDVITSMCKFKNLSPCHLPGNCKFLFMKIHVSKIELHK